MSNLRIHDEMKATLDWLINEKIKLTDSASTAQDRYVQVLEQVYRQPTFEKMSRDDLIVMVCDCLAALIDNYSDLITKS